MSERTTIGGTVYESIGSSSSNLLLKCNGTARIQWGNKLIDLIKNGKLAANGDSWQVDVVSDISEIKSDGIYVLNIKPNPQLWICKNGEQYNLTGADLYISASTKQEITVEQQKQALENIGIYYNTLADVQNAGIKNGLVYVIETKQLYTIQDGIIEEFEAKLKTVTVEQQEDQGEIINSPFKIVLSVLDQEYITLENQQILVNYPIILNDTSIESNQADANRGFRLYSKGTQSCLEVDELIVRNGLPIKDYIDITYDALYSLYISEKLEPHQWYLINDYQNIWKIPAKDFKWDRPILVRALTNHSFYKEGLLSKDRRVSIHYDITYKEPIILNKGTESEETITTKGLITWMKDSNNNEANFDFLNYTDHEGNPLATLHDSDDILLDQSIFPKGSYNNKLTIYDLKGTVLNEGALELINVNEIDFQFPDTKPKEEMTEGEILPTMVMHDNIITCRGLVVKPTCQNFHNNTLSEVCKVIIETDFINNNLSLVYSTLNKTPIDSFYNVTDNSVFIDTVLNTKIQNTTMTGLINSVIGNSMAYSTFEQINNCTIKAQCNEVQFKNLTNCVFDEGVLASINCYHNITDYSTSSTKDPLLYDTSKIKEVYFTDGKLTIHTTAEQSFGRGMIVMHSGIAPIPAGWAVCDGGEYTYNGVTSKTPNLINRFIKAVGSSELVSPVDNSDLNTNNEFTLQEQHLPEHSHPHKAHTHTFEGTGTDSISQTINVVTSASEKQAIVTMEGGTSGYSGDDVTSEDVSISGDIKITISGNTSSTTSEENTKTWTNKSFKIEPNYYSLIFIMKL